MSMEFGIESEVVRLLQRYELFVFDDAVSELLGRFVADVASPTPNVVPLEEVKQLTDLLHLAAAEYSLIPLLADPAHATDSPTLVVANDAALAALKYDCSILKPCRRRSPRDYGASDLTVFSADTSRFLSLVGDWEALTNDPNQLRAYVAAVEAAHRGHPSPLVRAVGETGVIRTQGLLWSLRLTVMGQPGYLQSLEESLRDYLGGTAGSTV